MLTIAVPINARSSHHRSEAATYSIQSSQYCFDGESWQMIFTRAQFVIHFNRRKYRPMRDALRQKIIAVCDTKIRAKGEMVGVSF